MVQLPAEEIFHILGFPITNTIIASWFTILVVVGMVYAATRRVRPIPSRLQSLVEFFFGWMLNLCEEAAGKEQGRRFFPVVATIFIFVIMNAWLALLPFFGPGIHIGEAPLFRCANTDVNMPLALAIVSFISVEYWGVSSLGARHYLSRFFNIGPLWGSVRQLFKGKLRAGLSGILTSVIEVFAGLLEALSEVIRLVSFTFRLFGNMTAGEILLLIVCFLIPWVLVIPFYGLELLIGFIQAMIFGGLTLGFATAAVASREQE
jgi:F-type H+-transporting ATPase subunit a